MELPDRKDCIHAPVCKYDDSMCPMECGYFETRPPDSITQLPEEIAIERIKAGESVKQVFDDYGWDTKRMGSNNG